MTSTDFVGLVPAAGRGTRLSPLRYPKELLPIVYEPAEGGARLRPVAEYALESLARAGVGSAILVVAPWKLEVIGYLGDGRHLGVDVAYLFQEEARGLACALDLARGWTRGRHVVFAMPDTIFTPSDALTRLRGVYEETGADLALAVFPTRDAHRLGPVVTRGDRVRRVFDKPADPPVMNTWGAAIWTDAFADLLHEGLRETTGDSGDAGTTGTAGTAGTTAGEPVLGHYFDLAVRRGLRVHAVEFPDGSFQDVGTPLGVRRSVEGPSLLAVGP
ncbi:glucose-1-phosphate thymidylyltransferase [Streptosporangium becharense]|uniref:Glucose-1-phosphate thymidylyltransferase n=1 Tax=Streptosporangium becharense TaxID=1816182 RepID=A0A7W9IMW2_9ACTN|nr:sugar phosphate nucleotidyltransferase [Streptosporangium becharense]MBB2910552.1 glucose-1-phosphate thymidylyltransferase [Streptosporangium becharense]MBB5823295.1 glucose-1-phosphate thymidylyltransferase [Streptosporangium becharense]